MGLFSLAKLFGITIRESANDGSDFTNPDADYRRLFLGEDGQLHVKDSAGTVTDIGAGSVATDAIWDTAGDIVQATGANAAAKLALGTASQQLRVNAGATALEYFTPSAGAGVVPWTIQPAGLAVNLTNRTIGAANRAVYSAVTIPADCTVDGITIPIGTQNGNVCAGLYDSAGSRVATSGSVACPAGGANRNIDFTSGYAATAGRYYIGLSADNNTATFGWHQQVSSGLGSSVDSRFQATAHPLPTSITSGGAIAGPPCHVLRVNGGTP